VPDCAVQDTPREHIVHETREKGHVREHLGHRLEEEVQVGLVAPVDGEFFRPGSLGEGVD
jgi:hypothetical protein